MALPLAPNAELKQIATGFALAEGPVYSRRGYLLPETKALGEKQFIGERGIRHRVLGIAELINLLVGITNENLRAALLPDDRERDRVGVLSFIKEDRVVIQLRR